MTYRGRIENGMAVLEGDARLPDGTLVEVVPIRAETPSPLDDPLYHMDELALPGGITDLAENLDHYLYGHPRAGDEQP